MPLGDFMTGTTIEKLLIQIPGWFRSNTTHSLLMQLTVNKHETAEASAAAAAAATTQHTVGVCCCHFVLL